MSSEWLEAHGIPWCYRADSPRCASSERAFVINLDDRGQDGTHWVAARRVGDTLFYADPFGTALNGYPPKELSALRLREVINSKAWQRPSTNYCGYYAACFVKALNDLSASATQKDLEAALWKSIR